jgi:trehalose 6-phosphate synthase
LLVAAFPVNPGSAGGHLLILHDLSFIDERAARARFYTAATLMGVIAGMGLLAAALVLGLLRSWSQLVRSAIDDARRGVEPTARRAGQLPIGAEMRSLLSEFRVDRKDGDGIQVQWSPQTLHRLLDERLPGTEIIAVSNREPYIHNRDNGSTSLQIPASGLVAALAPVMRACRDGSHMAVDQPTAKQSTGTTASSTSGAAYTLRRVAHRRRTGRLLLWFSNEGLWPLCHIVFVRPTFRQGTGVSRGGQPALR